jgi:hypothetical protein
VNATEATRQSTRAIPSRLVKTGHGATKGPPALVHLRDGPAHLLRLVAVPRVVSRAVGSGAAALLVSVRDLSARLRAAMIETMPLENAAEAYAKMMSGKALSNGSLRRPVPRRRRRDESRQIGLRLN